MPNKRLIVLIFASASLVSPNAQCSEGGGSNYLPGFYGDFGMALMPKPGLYFYNFFAAYEDRAGNTANILEMPGFEWVTDYTIFGGRYFAGVFPALMATWDNTGTLEHGRVALGDAYLLPIGISWQIGDLTATAFEGIVAPTGYYELGQLNPGRNVWTFDHNLLLTWNLPGQNELSVTLGYMNNLENPATHYTTGDELHFDYTVSHYLAENVALGIAGSHYQQITGDQARDYISQTPNSESSTIGPAIMYTPHVAGRDLTLSLKWLHEFDVIGRIAQDYLIFRTFVEF